MTLFVLRASLFKVRFGGRWEDTCHLGLSFGKMHQSMSLLPEGNAMHTKRIRIVDLGRGPQIEGHRLTVMDVFYYLQRGYDFDFIHRAMPRLTRKQFDAIAKYVNEHHAELVEKDRRVEEFHDR